MKYKFTLYATMGDTQIIIESERYKVCIEAVVIMLYLVWSEIVSSVQTSGLFLFIVFLH